MSNKHLVVSDIHARPGQNLELAYLLGLVIKEVKPDIVINNGDMADMYSLNSYDRNSKVFQGASYGQDIQAHLAFQELMWEPIKRQKKKMPRRVVTIGNHDERINKALNLSPELDGAISIRDLDLESYYDDVVPYAGSTPGQITIDGVMYAHYCVSGAKGLPIGGVHPAHSLVTKNLHSTTVGHSHFVDFTPITGASGKRFNGLVTGTFSDHTPNYAGASANQWWRGLVICHNVRDGQYDPQFVSISNLRQYYKTELEEFNRRHASVVL